MKKGLNTVNSAYDKSKSFLTTTTCSTPPFAQLVMHKIYCLDMTIQDMLYPLSVTAHAHIPIAISELECLI